MMQQLNELKQWKFDFFVDFSSNKCAVLGHRKTSLKKKIAIILKNHKNLQKLQEIHTDLRIPTNLTTISRRKKSKKSPQERLQMRAKSYKHQKNSEHFKKVSSHSEESYNIISSIAVIQKKINLKRKTTDLDTILKRILSEVRINPKKQFSKNRF